MSELVHEGLVLKVSSSVIGLVHVGDLLATSKTQAVNLSIVGVQKH